MAEDVVYFHDVLVSLWMPYDEKINPRDRKDDGCIESSVHRPLQTFGAEDLYPSLYQKAAALFQSLVCNHCFLNGNKRTAVIALEMFMLGNGAVIISSSEEIYTLACETADANRRGFSSDESLARVRSAIEEGSFSLTELKSENALAAVGIQNVEKLMNKLASWIPRHHTLEQQIKADSAHNA